MIKFFLGDIHQYLYQAITFSLINAFESDAFLKLEDFLKNTSEHSPPKEWKYKMFQNSSKLLRRLHFFPSESWECVLFDNETKIFVAHIRARGYCYKVVTHKNFKRFFLLFSIVQISSWSLRHEQWYGKFQGSKPSFDQEKKNQSSKVTPKILSTIYIMFFC